MGIEGQFAGLTVPTRRQPAFVRNGRGKGYLSDIGRFAMLERDQEFQLAKRWREHGDRDAADQLVASHLRLAAKVAMGYRGYGLPVSEIISEGNIGLMQALNRFEPERGFRFASYAVWWIRACIQDYILRSWSLVKIGTTSNQRKLFFKLRSAKNKIAALESGDLHPDQVALIAKSLDVPDQDVIDMNRRLGGDQSINSPVRTDGEANGASSRHAFWPMIRRRSKNSRQRLRYHASASGKSRLARSRRCGRPPRPAPHKRRRRCWRPRSSEPAAGRLLI